MNVHYLCNVLDPFCNSAICYISFSISYIWNRLANVLARGEPLKLDIVSLSLIYEHITSIVLHIKGSHYSFIAVRFNKKLIAKGVLKISHFQKEQDQNGEQRQDWIG